MVLQLRLGDLKAKAVTQEIEWKLAVPHPAERHVLSVVAGNTHIYWGWHESQEDQYAPTLFWRTPPATDEEMKRDPTEVLGNHIPEQFMRSLFGQEKEATKHKAAKAAAMTNAPAMSIYVISSNPDHEKRVLFLFSGIPHRIFRLENSDFFTKEQGLYPTLGVDRACALFSAVDRKILPALVFDGGTAWTYSAVDAEGKIMGGGIAPGIGARLGALSHYCGMLPFIEPVEFDEAFDYAFNNNSPIPIFASDTKTAMISSTVQEVAGQARNIVKHFLEHVKTKEKDDNGMNGSKNGDSAMQVEPTPEAAKTTEGFLATNSNGHAAPAAASTDTTTPGTSATPHETPTVATARTNSKPTVFVTGGDSKYLMRLLEFETPSVVVGEPGVTLPVDNFDLKHGHHIIHYGVGLFLKKQVDAHATPTEDDMLRQKIVGLRVAVEFPSADSTGDNVYRGSIVDARRAHDFEEDLYLVRYDDGDTEWVDIKKVYASLVLFVEKGEKESEEQREQEEQNKEVSKKQADAVFTRSETVRKYIAEEEEQKKRKNNDVGDKSLKRAKAAKIDGIAYVDHRVAKMFPMENKEGIVVDTLFFGTIKGYEENGKLWQIVYDDDDQEEFDERDLKTALRLYDEHKATDFKLQGE